MARERLQIVNEWFWNKKEDNSNSDRVPLAELWLKIQSYQKDMINLYTKAIESFASDLFKDAPNPKDTGDDDFGYRIKDMSRVTRYYATNTASPFHTCRKRFEEQLKTIGLDLKKIDTNNNFAYDVYLYWYPGENGLYSFYEKELLDVHTSFVLTTTYDGYSRITKRFNEMSDIELNKVKEQILKDINNCVEKGYTIKTPNLDKFEDKYIDGSEAKKYWDDGADVIPTAVYGFIRQGMYLKDPKFTKQQLKNEVSKIFGDNTNVSNESLDVPKKSLGM